MYGFGPKRVLFLEQLHVPTEQPHAFPEAPGLPFFFRKSSHRNPCNKNMAMCRVGPLKAQHSDLGVCFGHGVQEDLSNEEPFSAL